MDRHQRRRARGVDGNRRTAQPQQVRDAPDGHRVRIAGRGVGVDGIRVGCRNRLVFAVIDAHQDGGTYTGQILGRNPGMLERFVGDLAHQPLLGIHRLGFARRDTEVVGFEAGHVGQEAAPLGRHPSGRELICVVELVGVPAVRRDLADPVAAVGQEVPVALGAVSAAGETAADAHHRDRLSGDDPGRTVEFLRDRVPLFAGHRRNSVVNGRHQKIPLSLLAEAASTLANKSSNTLRSRSVAEPADSSSGASAGASRPATYVASEAMVGWLNNIFADTSSPTSFLVSLRTVMAIIESRPSSGNGTSSLIADGDILNSRPKMACNRVCSWVSRSSADNVDQSGTAAAVTPESSPGTLCSTLATVALNSEA